MQLRKTVYCVICCNAEIGTLYGSKPGIVGFGHIGPKLELTVLRDGKDRCSHRDIIALLCQTVLHVAT